MSAPNCLFHPSLAHLIPQKTVGEVEISTSANPGAGRTTQEPTGIELPNPNLAVYQNVLGDYAAYPLAVPMAKKAEAKLPSADLYQRATRRPWDISQQQFAKQVNKRKSFSLAVAGALFLAIMPFVPKPGQSVDTGARAGFGLKSQHFTVVPGPVKDNSFAA